MTFRSLSALLVGLLLLDLAGTARGATPLPKAQRIPRGKVVLDVLGRKVTYGEYLKAVRQGWPCWDLLLALPGGDKIPSITTPQEWIFQREFAEPEVMERVFFPDQKDEMRARAQEIFRRAKRGDDWGKLVTEYTTDPDGPGRDGSIGLVSFDQLRPPFARAMFTAPLGEVQPPVLTLLGWQLGRVKSIVPARDGKPEKREVEQIVLLWDPAKGTQAAEEGAQADMRVVASHLRSVMHVAVLDERLCKELPHYCAANAREREAAAESAKAGAEDAAPAPAPSTKTPGDAGGEHPPGEGGGERR